MFFTTGTKIRNFLPSAPRSVAVVLAVAAVAAAKVAVAAVAAATVEAAVVLLIE